MYYTDASITDIRDRVHSVCGTDIVNKHIQ